MPPSRTTATWPRIQSWSTSTSSNTPWIRAAAPGPDAKAAAPARDSAKAAAPARDSAKVAANKAEAAKLKTLGYVGTPKQQSQRVNPDWTHVNSVDYNAELDQIVVSVHELSEIWIIDHSTTKAEAAGHTGGRSGKGGDLLYRWGNPLAYRAGTKADQTLFVQHNAQWIRRGLPGEGHVLVFNNGGHRPDGSYSSVDELVLPVDGQGRYKLEPGKAFGPKKAALELLVRRTSPTSSHLSSRAPTGCPTATPSSAPVPTARSSK